jgi:hypothetical protein
MKKLFSLIFIAFTLLGANSVSAQALNSPDIAWRWELHTFVSQNE